MLTKLFVGRQPIYNRKLAVDAYELLYRADDAGGAGIDKSDPKSGDQATVNVILTAVVEIGLESLVGTKQAFINIPRAFFDGTYPLPKMSPRVILQIMGDMAMDAELKQNLDTLSRRGYKLMLDDVSSVEQVAMLAPIVQSASIDISAMPREQLAALVGGIRAKFPRVKLLAERVETRDDYDVCFKLGFDYFQGYFLCKPVIMTGQRVETSRAVVLQMLDRIMDPLVDFKALADIVSRDVALSYKLLKLINSARYATSQPVTSIEQAIRLLGVNKLRDWLTLLLMTSIESKPNELTVIALSRAKLCELMALSLHKKARTESYFAVGLFSVLDALVDLPMAEAVAQLPLAVDVKSALLRKEGLLGHVLDLARADLKPAELRDSYVKAVAWAEAMTHPRSS